MAGVKSTAKSKRWYYY